MNNCIKLISVLIGCALLNGCSGSQGNPGATGAQGNDGVPGLTGAPGVTGPAASPSPAPSPDAIQTIVGNYNAYLVSQGTDPLTPGLKCTLYTVPNLPATPCLLAADVSGCTQLSTTTGYATVGSFDYVGTFNQPNEAGTAGFNVLPTALQSLYPTNFAMTCTGYFVNPDYNYHEFDVSSDDGSLMYINGSLVVQNDGEHAIQDVKAEKYLQAQVYSFQLNYFQGPGNVALIVNEDGSVVSAESFWH